MSDEFEALFEEIAAKRAAESEVPNSISAVELSATGSMPTESSTDISKEPATDLATEVSPEQTPGDLAPDADPDVEVGAQSLPNSVVDVPLDHDKPMFERLGGIVRLLHDSLTQLGYDKTISDAASQIGDAQGRLDYIATLTEQAANKVLNTIDEGIPAQDAMTKNARDMDNRWALLFDGKLSVEEFKTLAADSRQFAGMVADASEVEKARLLSIMMAQDFQDITGQLIKKIVGITQRVESELAQLLRDNAPVELLKEREKSTELTQGPTTSALVQDDVDSLLEGLGF